MKRKISIQSMLFGIALIPLVITALLITLYCTNQLEKTMLEDLREVLKVTCDSGREYFADRQGEWELSERDYNYIDSHLNDGIVQTVFVGDTRYLSSIKNENGIRVSGTQANSDVIMEVFNNGNDYSALNVNIYEQDYAVYYTPIKQDGQIVGMMFAGKPMDEVNKTVKALRLKTLIIAIVIMTIFAGIIVILSFKIKKPIETVAQACSELSDGKLNIEQCENSMIKEIHELINCTDRLKEKIGNIIHGIKVESNNLSDNANNLKMLSEASVESVSQVDSAIHDVAQGNTELAEQATTQMASIEELGSNLDEITEKVNLMQDKAEETLNASKTASYTMEELIEINATTKDNINSIVEQSENNVKSVNNINSIVGTIEDIASQTNLLSLNASIEAARAGDAGRGFSVVANNIRELAEKSAAETKNIKTIITELIEEVKKTSELSSVLLESSNIQNEKLDITKDTFNQIISKINEVSEHTEDVTHRVNAISNVKMQVNEITENLSSVSEETSASAQQVSASTTLLNQSVSEVSDLSNEVAESANKMSEYASYFTD